MQIVGASRAKWRKSTRSNGAGGNCVEIADLVVGVGVRDSKAPDVGHLTFTREAWMAFATQVRAGRYNR
ncbi:DUF397 domain-containing protein [Actinomadura chokoriensis]|uniref:DUF397 domain-containing protein n=1 Tax=Actinomadura chokoriensis TaxID=454156 RepID=A0ABV4R6R2_9ACTN